MIKSLLQSIWKWLILLLVIACAGFLFIHFLWPNKPQVTLPGGQVINLDTRSFNNSVQQMNRQMADQGKKVNDLESTIRQLQSQIINQGIPGALKETNITASVDRMKAAW